MATNKRIPVKWVRDRAKSAYVKKPTCYICGTAKDLELHHLCSVTYLLDTWAAENGHDISTDDGILAVRDAFIAAHNTEIYKDVYTLCNKDHIKLHGVFGKTPLPSTVDNQRKWIEKQAEASSSGKPPKSSSSFSFGEFC